MSDSESQEATKARAEPRITKEEEAEPQGAEGAVIAKRQEPAADGAEAAGDEAPAEESAAAGGDGASAPVAVKRQSTGANTKPSNTLILRNLPDDLDASDLEMRLMRFGDVLSLAREGDVFVAKFKKTNMAYEAKQKLDGSSPYGATIEVEFGAQEADHYLRGAKKGRAPAGTGLRSEADGDGASAPVGAVKRQVDDDAEAPLAKRPATARTFGSMTLPAKPVSKWSEQLTFEEQLEDFMKMPRRGMYNRYLVLGKLPPELRTGSAIWNMVAPVQRDIMHIEMLTCFGKPVAHVALRSATAAAAMHRIAEQLHPNLTVAFAPPRKASKALWLGNVDDFVNRKDLEEILEDFGKTVNGMRYVPARTCAFVTFTDQATAIKARNMLYGLPVQKNQYLNVDYVDEWAAEQAEAMNAWGAQGWQPMQGAPWGMPGPWGVPPPPPGFPGKGGGRRGEMDRRNGGRGGAWPAPPYPGGPGYAQGGPPERERDEGRGGRRRSRSRTPPGRRRGRDAESPGREAAKGRTRRKAQPSESPPPEREPPKVKVKLYKMGEFCCNIVANFVKGKEEPDPLQSKLHIDQRTKIDHCKAHMDRAGGLATIWHFSAADRKDCAAYDALCDYFVEKERVGLVQTPACYIYIVPPTEKYLGTLGLPSSNFVVGIQIPMKK